MRINRIHIRNFKSLVDFELDSPKPFCAFVGPNASGKSNIFEALELTNYVFHIFDNAPNLFGGLDIKSFNAKITDEIGHADVSFYYEFGDTVSINFYLDLPEFPEQRKVQIGRKPDRLYNLKPDILNIMQLINRNAFLKELNERGVNYENDYEQFIDNFTRIFIGKTELKKFPLSPNQLALDASNLSDIIGHIFESDVKRRDFIEWLRILIPEFENIEVKNSNIDGSFDFLIYEKSSNKPFPKRLLSDGTKNILSLMAAVYQSSQPQFLCIEEPENGLHPEAIELLVDFFREKVESEGHHIWVNTHSPTLVRCMNIDEIVLVNKINGETRARKVDNAGNAAIKTDEAWLSNALGGGVSWSK